MGKCSVLIIGLGNVAVGYDLHLTNTEEVLTHARSFVSHPSFYLAGGVDSNSSARERFALAYGLPTFDDIKVAMEVVNPEVVVVATPTTLHLDSVQKIFTSDCAAPKILLCEKPLAYGINEAKAIVNLCKKNNCFIYINYFRRCEPGVVEIRDRIADGRINSPLKGVVWYSKGLFNSASHFIDLLSYLLGPIIAFNVLDCGRQWGSNDIEPDFEVQFKMAKVVFLAARAENFFHNSFELLCVNGRLRYEQGGAQIVWQGIERDDRFSSYVSLNDVTETMRTDFNRIQWYVAQQLAGAIKGRATQLCSGKEGLKTEYLLESIRKEYDRSRVGNE